MLRCDRPLHETSSSAAPQELCFPTNYLMGLQREGSQTRTEACPRDRPQTNNQGILPMLSTHDFPSPASVSLFGDWKQ